MIKYRTYGTYFRVDSIIDKVEVEGETEFCVYINGQPQRKNADNRCYHDTWKDAHEFLIRHAKSLVEANAKQLKLSQDGLDKILAMEEK